MPEIVGTPEEAEGHRDEWLLFRTTGLGDLGRPIKGSLLFHGTSREELHREAVKLQDIDRCAFFTGDPAPPGMVVLL